MSSIRLHPEHGVNATIPTCRWCGKDKNEVVLLGNAYKGKAPMKMAVDDQPCDACQKRMKLGITFIEMDKEGPGAKRTGNWWVVQQEAVESWLLDPALLAGIMDKRMCCVTPETVAVLGLNDVEPTIERV